MNSPIQIMLDIETAGPAPDGAIVSIGFAIFTLDGDGPIRSGRFDVDVQSCVDVGMKLDPDTIAWWLRQDPPVRALWSSPKRRVLKEALTLLHTVIWETERLGNRTPIWAYPATFDLTIIDRAFVLCGYDGIRPRRQDYMCSRSVMKALGYRRNDKCVPSEWRRKHDPEADAVRQVYQLQDCIRWNKETKECTKSTTPTTTTSEV